MRSSLTICALAVASVVGIAHSNGGASSGGGGHSFTSAPTSRPSPSHAAVPHPSGGTVNATPRSITTADDTTHSVNSQSRYVSGGSNFGYGLATGIIIADRRNEASTKGGRHAGGGSTQNG